MLKDVLLPPEIRGAATALIVARQRGAALLEEARAETAALRSLANGARLLDAHPALARLRLVQAVPPARGWCSPSGTSGAARRARDRVGRRLIPSATVGGPVAAVSRPDRLLSARQVA